MSPKDALAILTKLVANPYAETYRKMSKYELISWKHVFEASLALGASSREKVRRLKAVNRALKDIQALGKAA